MHPKRRTKAVLATLAVLAAGMSVTVSDPMAQEMKLTYSSALPAKHIGNAVGLAPYFEKVGAATGGKVHWNLVPGGALGNFREAFATIRDRVVDGAAVVDINARQDLPLTATLSSLSLLGSDPRVMAGAMNQTVMIDVPLLWQEWTSKKVRPMAAYALAPFLLMCRQEVATAEQVKGKKIRADGGFGNLMKDMGAVPVTIESTEIYEAMRRGQIDCVVGSSAWLKSFSLWDVVKFVNEEPLGLFFGAWIFTMNTGVWDSFSPEQKKAHYDLIPSLVRRSVQQYSIDGVEERKTSAEKGIRFYAPQTSFRKAVDSYRERDTAEVIKQARDRGLNDADKVVAAFLANVTKWEKIVADTGDDYDKYEQALAREIFSKVKH